MVVKRKSKKESELQRHSSANNSLTDGERSVHVQAFKEKTGLVTKEEIKSLPFNNIEELKQKVALLESYTIANQHLVDLFGSVGGRAVNALNQVVDLQARLLVLEESCKEQGLNPLEHPGWLKARQMLASETQFIHKHGLDAAEVRSRIDSRGGKRGEDVMFDIKVEEE